MASPADTPSSTGTGTRSGDPAAAPRKRAAATTAKKPVTPQSPKTTAKRNATVASNARAKAARATVTEAKSGAALVGTYAEKAVLVPVGAALTARDKVVELVEEVLETYSTRKKTEAQIKRFERRGISARNRIEREARKARTRAGREVGKHRSTVSGLDRRREEATKAVTDAVEDVGAQIKSVATKAKDTVRSIV